MKLTAIDRGERTPEQCLESANIAAEASTSPHDKRRFISGIESRRRHKIALKAEAACGGPSPLSEDYGINYRQLLLWLSGKIPVPERHMAVLEAAAEKGAKRERVPTTFRRTRAFTPEKIKRLRKIIKECIDKGMSRREATFYLAKIGEPVSRTWVGKQADIMGLRPERVCSREAIPLRTERLRRVIAHGLERGMTQAEIAAEIRQSGDAVCKRWMRQQIRLMGTKYVEMARDNKPARREVKA